MQIINTLITKNLLYNATVSEKTVYERKKGGNTLGSSKQTLIIGKTKALLFSAINEELRNKYPKNMPLLYSLPIVYADIHQAKELMENTKEI
ncbi:hypothetical protein [Spongiimicrobium sp. 3-5]|uniref:hypothetical protein n=1 Tax=Spongiimicrobium sp. 3-5 TaxID=3332596 RepID=UPI00397F181D